MVHMDASAETILEGLDDAQRAAATTVNGPVRIIAGAGAGKTRTVTRRIAYACATGEWDPRRALAVTFSVKAAAEMRSRLSQLEVDGAVKAATFHSAALHQIRRVWPDLCEGPFPHISRQPRELVARSLRRVTTMQVDDETVRNLQAEINWCKISLVAPNDYQRVCAATHRQPPAGLEPDQFTDVYQAYETEKTARGEIDFDDILLIACHVLESYDEASAAIRSSIGWLTVDEYQDVSPLQHRLLTRWLSGNRNICVVGDPAQTIYYLVLQSGREQGPRVTQTVYASDTEEAQGVAMRIAKLASQGVSPSDCAILTRINAQQQILCKALQEQHLCYRMRRDSGWQNSALADDAQTRLAMLEALGVGSDMNGVTISTIHASKGLEFKHVFLIGCSEGLLPYGSPQDGDQLEEERRLLYVGVTRAEDTLHLSYARSKDCLNDGRGRRVSRFLS